MSAAVARDIAGRANAAHNRAVQAASKAILHARDAGRALIEAKAVVGHGAWRAWLQGNFAASERQAQRYMSLAARWPELEAKTTRAADLSVRRALELLDGRTELQRALALGAEQDAIRAECRILRARTDTADLPELHFIIDRAGELSLQAAENRMRAERELGRLLLEAGA